MAWIKSDVELENHPKLFKLISLTGWNKYEAIGRLHCFWYWTLKYAESGDLSKYTNLDLSQALGLPKESLIIDSLISAGFLDVEPLRVHDWVERTGQFLKVKYHTSNPKKYKKIVDEHRKALGKPKVSPKEDPDKIRLDKIRLDKTTTISEVEKLVFGYFKNVYLTDDEYKKLVERYGASDAYVLIDRLSSYISSRGAERKYKSHYATILSWVLKDKNTVSPGAGQVTAMKEYVKPQVKQTDTELKSYCCNASFTQDKRCSACNEDYSPVNSGIKIALKSV